MKNKLLPSMGQAVFLTILVFSVFPLHFITQMNRQIWDGGSFWMFSLVLTLLLGTIFAAVNAKQGNNPGFRRGMGFVFTFLGFAAALGLIFSVHPVWMIVLVVLCLLSFLCMCSLYRQTLNLRESLLVLLTAAVTAGMCFIAVYLVNHFGLQEIWVVRSALALAAFCWLLSSLPLLGKEKEKKDKTGKHTKDKDEKAALPLLFQATFTVIALGGTVYAFSLGLGKTHIFLMLLAGLAAAVIAATLCLVRSGRESRRPWLRFCTVLCLLAVVLGVFAGIWQGTVRYDLLNEGQDVIDNYVKSEGIDFITALRLKSALNNSLSGDKPQDAYTANLFYLLEQKTLTVDQAVDLNGKMTAALGDEALWNDFTAARKLSLVLMYACAGLSGFALGGLYAAKQGLMSAKSLSLYRIWPMQALGLLLVGIWPIAGFYAAALFIIIALITWKRSETRA